MSSSSFAFSQTLGFGFKGRGVPVLVLRPTGLSGLMGFRVVDLIVMVLYAVGLIGVGGAEKPCCGGP